MTNDEALLDRAYANYHELFRATARISPHGAIEEANGVLLVGTGPLLPLYNFATVTRVPADPAAVVARAQAFFARLGVRCMLSATGAAAEAMAPVAEAAGMTPGSSPGMLLSPLDGDPPPVSGLVVRVVQDAETLRVFAATMTEGFGGPWVMPEMLGDDTPLLRVPDLTFYLGYLDGRPVATATRFASHRIAGVFDVSTIPAHRRRGIGEAMTWRAALDGRDEGCIASYLQASEMGFPVYRRMGYRQVTTHRTWLSPETSGTG